MAFHNNSSLESPYEAPPMDCFSTTSGVYIVPSFTAVWTFILFPLYSLVLHSGFQRWRRDKRAAVSHTDFFTYHTCFFELVTYCGFATITSSTFRVDFPLAKSGVAVLTFASPGVLSLHVLTCVERYLAVVYPVVYLSLKSRRRLWARNLIILTIWLFCLSWMWIVKVTDLKNQFLLIMIKLLIMASVVIFCGVQVLHALRSPSPGEGRGVSKSKRKAFFTMSAILSVLMLRISCGLFIYGIENTSVDIELICSLQKSECWFELPSSLVLPLLFLHRAGKLPKCRGKKMKD